jgi:hypothetical protein
VALKISFNKSPLHTLSRLMLFLSKSEFPFQCCPNIIGFSQFINKKSIPVFLRYLINQLIVSAKQKAWSYKYIIARFVLYLTSETDFIFFCRNCLSFGLLLVHIGCLHTYTSELHHVHGLKDFPYISKCTSFTWLWQFIINQKVIFLNLKFCHLYLRLFWSYYYNLFWIRKTEYTCVCYK